VDLQHVFSIDSGGFWVEVDGSCSSQPFNVTCDAGFSTNLFFREDTSQLIHVVGGIKSASAGGFIEEEINSLCLKSGSSCNYEGSLWGAFALELAGEDITSYLPYLIGLKERNLDHLPEAFLYYLTDDEDFASSLKSKQKRDENWDESGQKYYDTAVALFPFTYEDFDEKSNAIAWLEEKQDGKGCWNNKDITDTAFLLHSIWPETSSLNLPIDDPTVPQTNLNCLDEGYFCMSNSACSNTGGTKLGYDCAGYYFCCSQDEDSSTCEEVGGTACQTGEICSGSEDTSISMPSGEFCCKGTCEEDDGGTGGGVLNECEVNFGSCKSSCDSDETEKIL